MAKVTKLVSRKRQEPSVESSDLHLGAWLRALEVKPSQVVKDTGINFGYLSELISGKKKNPSFQKLTMIADYLGIEVGELRKAPPAADVLKQISSFSPSALQKLAKRRFPTD